MTRVLVLGGGPDAEREVSLRSAAGVAGGLREAERFEVIDRTIDRLTLSELRSLPGDVIFPVLHGGWGEGGQLQDLLVADGRPYVGCGPEAARLAMDKVAAKLVAAGAGVPTPRAFVFDPRDPVCPVGFPAIIKPVHEGSTIGLRVINDEREWLATRAAIATEFSAGDVKAYMIEPRVIGQELTVPVVDGRALPVIRITPAAGLYDYQAKYHRNDTRYEVAPSLPAGVTELVQKLAVATFRALGCRHLARIDFMLDGSGTPWLLEANTMPGFTATSLVPKSAKAEGMSMSRLCATLVDLALRDAGSGCSGVR